MADNPFDHHYSGHQIRIEQGGCDVHLVFVTNSLEQSEAMVEWLMDQLRDGELNINLTMASKSRTALRIRQ